MYIFWVIIAILFLVLDFAKKNKYFLVLACSAMFSSIFAYKMQIGIVAQVFGFVFLYGVFSFLIKGSLKREQKELSKLKKQQELIGKSAVVTKDIAKTISIDGIGLVELEGEIWQAKSIDDKEIKAGKQVIIKSRENLILNVEEVFCGSKN